MTSRHNGSELRLLFTDLPEDVVIIIFGYCDFKTLLNIAQVCRSFNRLASDDILWRRILRKCVNGSSRKRLLPWLQLNHSSLFVSEENSIKTFCRHQGRRRVAKPVSSIVCGTDDVAKFVVKKDRLVSGVGKTLTVWNIKDKPYSKRKTFLGHTMPIYCVDILGDVVLSGSRDRSVKIWSLVSGECVNTVQIGDPVRSVVVNSFYKMFVAGSAGYLKRHSPLRLYDCETGLNLCELACDSTPKLGAGVLDMKFDSPNILLSCGYDTAVRLWDIRNNSRQCVKKWEDPHDSAVYCIDSDKKWMILSGTYRYGVVRMWDKRMDRSVKYFNVGRHSTSPVYSLKFNQTKLFVALDNKVNILNFNFR